MTVEHVKNTMSRDIEDREKALADLRQKLLDREKVTETLRQSLDDNDNTISSLKSSIQEQETSLHTLRDANLRREREMRSLQEQLREHDSDNAYKIALTLTLANAAYDGLLVINRDFEVIASNRAAEAIFSVDRAIGMRLIDLTHAPELVESVEDAIANDEELLEDQLTYNKRFYRVRMQVIRREGHFFIALAFQDVSELVRLNRARRDMVANISHELRTPIANIRLIIEGLFHEQEKPKRKQSAGALRAIARETDSLLWLVQELLDLSMIETGQAILRMVDLSLNDVVDESIVRLEDLSADKDIRLVSRVPLNTNVLADHDQVRRVLVNLMHNSVKWSPAGGLITVDAENSGDMVIVTVSDAGPGVPEEHTERIFERFYQVDPSRSVGEGTGLGLAICKHIIEAHGGTIWALGNDGGKRGGVFQFSLGAAETVS
jgi:two-component system, OmpR family, phosphate regulon sensor histidine kinase PhoR